MNKNEIKIFCVLFVTIFSAVTGVGIVIPLLPVYAHDLGASGFYISLIFGSFSISRTILLPYFGRMSDRRGRKPYIVFGLFTYAVISVAFMMASSVETIIFLRLFQGVASAMIIPVAQAYVADITPEGKEGRYMGLFNMAMFASLSLGPFMGGIINVKYGLGAAFMAMGILAAVAFVLSALLLPSIDHEQIKRYKKRPGTWKLILTNPMIMGLCAFRFTYTTCVGVIWCFLPVYATTTFNLDSAAIGTLVMLMVLIGGVVNTPMGFVTDKVKKPVLVLTGGLLIALAMMSIRWADGYMFLLISSIVFGIGGGISLPAVSAMAVLEGKRIEAHGSVMALLTMAHSMGMLVGSLIAGLTMDYFSLNNAFPLSAVIMILGMGLFVRCLNRTVVPIRSSNPI